MNYKNLVHWLSIAVYVFIFGRAGMAKVLKAPYMMEAMASIGFDENWTLLIGLAEVLGVVAILIGIYYPAVKNIAVIFLFPFAIGAFTVHMSYQHGFAAYWQSLVVCIMVILILWTDKKFRLIL